MRKRLNLSSALGIFLIGILLSSISEGLSQTTNYFTWNNTTTNWTTATAWTPNWTGGGTASSTANTNVAIFASTGVGNNTVNLSSDRTVYGLIFTNGANSYNFTNNVTGTNTPKQLDIMSGIGLQNISGQNQIFNLSVANNGNAFWTNGAGSTTTFNNGLNLTTASSTANRTLTLGGAGTWNVASAIANGGTATAGAVTVTATGTTTLSGNNMYDGLTTMNAAGGTLTLSGDNSGAAGGVTLTAGTLNINNNNALGSGALSLAGTGATINNTSGSAVVNAGNQAWAWSDGLAFGSATNTAANNLNLGTGVVTATSSRAIALAGSNTTLGIGALNIANTGTGRTITANGVGNTLNMAGMTLTANTSNAVAVTLAGTANIGVTGAIVNGQNFSNGVTITATGTTTFSGANTYTGATEIKSGATLRYGANDVTADNGGRILVDGGTFDLNSYTDTVSAMRVTAGGKVQGTGTLTANSVDSSGYSFALYGQNEISANLAGSAATLFKSTAGSVSLLSGNNSYGGATAVTSGTLKMGSSTALGSTTGSTTVSSGGSLDLNGQTGVGERTIFTGTGTLLNSAVGTTASVSGNMDLGSEMVVNTIGDITLNGQLTGASTRVVTKTGSGLLKVTASNSTFSGTNKVSAGTLFVDTGASIASSTSIVDGGLLNVNGTAGAVTVNNGGSLGGTGTVGAVNLNSGGSLNPGNSPGLLTADTATVLGNSTYNWQISAVSGAAGTAYDLFSVTSSQTSLLDMSAITGTATNKWNLVVTADGAFTGWTDNGSYEYVFAQAANLSLSAGFSTDIGTDVTSLFNITTSGIASLPNTTYNPDGDFKVLVGRGANDVITLNLMAIPEPSTGSMLGLGLAGLVATRLLRRKSS
ncbi:Autotransporter-associated beta strand repeat [Candidatus Methylacidiphilaceae bacterium]